MKKLKRILKRTDGAMYVDALLSLLILLAIVVGSLGVIFVFQKKKTLDNMAIELTRCIQLNGKVTNDFNRMFDVLTENMAEEQPTFEVETDYIAGTGNIQLGTTIVLRLEQETTIFKTIPITIKSKGVGNSEVYFKTD